VDQLLKFGGDSAKDKKIRELAQRVKTINLALEKERTMYVFTNAVARRQRIS
jgi:hypothetical protein